MKSSKKMNRRAMLRTSLSATAGTVAASLSIGKENTPTRGASPEQTEGPFYPIHEQEDKDADLTKVKGRKKRAKGEIIHIRGRILDQHSQPIPDVMVEVWQANAAGRYSHEKDTNPAPLDPNFQSWGQTTTDKDGNWGFKTIKPAPYPINPEQGAASRFRPPHIHFRIARRGYHELVTQCYFPGESLNEIDTIFQKLTKDEQKELTLAVQESKTKNFFTLDLHIQSAELAAKDIQTLDTYTGRYEFQENGSSKQLTITREDSKLFAAIDAFFPKVEILLNKNRRYSLSSRKSGYEIDFNSESQTLTLYRSDAPNLIGKRIG